MNLFWFVIFAVFSLEIRWSSADCPPSAVVHPCRCESPRKYEPGELIICEGHGIDLKSTLNRISSNRQANETHFYKLLVINSSLEEIESGALGNLTFDKIVIDECQQLLRIHWLAFSNTADRLKSFKLLASPNYSLSPTPYNLFDMLNSFKNIEFIYFFYLNISHIPSDAFRPLPKLNRLFLLIKHLSLADRAFYNLTNLTHLIWNSKVDYLPANALEFASVSNNSLFLNFYSNNFTDASFDSGWLNNINRPVEINLVDNKITFLKRNVFEPFLDDTRNNQIWRLDLNPLNCSDCRNAWLRKRQDKYKSQVIESYCNGVTNGPTIFDSNFDHCQQIVF